MQTPRPKEDGEDIHVARAMCTLIDRYRMHPEDDARWFGKRWLVVGLSTLLSWPSIRHGGKCRYLSKRQSRRTIDSAVAYSLVESNLR